MELTITPKNTIREIRRQFSRQFPGLKLGFYPHAHGVEQSSVSEKELPASLHPGDLQPLTKAGVFSFSPKTTVAEFEQALQKEFGLPVQVFRKAGDLWIETIQTDNLTLEKQNAMALATTRPASFNLNSLFL